MIKREPKSVLQLHRIQEAQREKICCEIPSRNAIHDRLCGPVCGFRSWGKETTPCPISGLPWDTFGGVRGGRNPLYKISRIRWVPWNAQKPDFPGKARATQRSETKQEKDLALYAPGRPLPPAVRAVFPGLQMALFSHGP